MPRPYRADHVGNTGPVSALVLPARSGLPRPRIRPSRAADVMTTSRTDADLRERLAGASGRRGADPPRPAGAGSGQQGQLADGGPVFQFRERLRAVG